MHSVGSRNITAKGLCSLTPLFIFLYSLLWNFYYLNSHERVEFDDYLEAGVPPPLPTSTSPTSSTRSHRDFWEHNRSTCFHLDNICSRDQGWFYSPSQLRHTTNNAHHHQPTIALWVNPIDIQHSHGYDIPIEERIKFNVSSSSSSSSSLLHEIYDDDTSSCSYSPTPYHIVVQSAYSDMMGEFYSRVILGLNRWMRDYPLRSNEDVQIYTHFVDRRKQTLFEGHRLLLGGLPTNNKFENFLSLMPKNDSSCRCYTKLIFCGYDVKNITSNSYYNRSSSETTSVDVDESKKEDDDNITVFKPRSMITNPKTLCAMITDRERLVNGNCVAYRKLRRDLFNTYSEKDPMLGQKIRQHRREILIQKGFIGDNHTGDVDEWTFVGLAHRKFRRKWLNIQEVMSMCDNKFTAHKIVCTTIDVEEATSPEEQLLMHRSLHAFIGVHGAQLTQGVLLPRHGYILELLPWVPFYLWGGWVATTHRPTPLGIIFHETDLNHVGYALGRESVPLCLHVDSSNEELERGCLMNKTSGVRYKFQWAGRDFNVPIRVIEDFITLFLRKDRSNSVCGDMRRRAEQKNFVLYNAFCRESMDQTRHAAEHYFLEVDEKQPKNIHTNSKAVFKSH